jgi:hypothetical protein
MAKKAEKKEETAEKGAKRERLPEKRQKRKSPVTRLKR